MAEWSNAPVLKTGVLQGTGGSNPSLSAKISVTSCKTTSCADFSFKGAPNLRQNFFICRWTSFVLEFYLLCHIFGDTVVVTLPHNSANRELRCKLDCNIICRGTTYLIQNLRALWLWKNYLTRSRLMKSHLVVKIIRSVMVTSVLPPCNFCGLWEKRHSLWRRWT